MKSIRGGTVLMPAGPSAHHIHIEGDSFVALPRADFLVDSAGDVIAPGFIDIQVNGGWGNDFSDDPTTIWEVGRLLPRTGVTTFVPTIVTSPPSVYDRAIEVIQAGPPDGYVGASVPGLHFEGPWIALGWRGAHNSSHLREPDPAVARRWADSGAVAIVTIAPELEGAPEVAAVLSESDVTVSAGHTGADYRTGVEALAGSWSAVTHLYNQMSPFGHRQPGMVGAALNSDAICGVIADGIHSDPGALQLAWRYLGQDRIALMTDAMAAVGLGDGSYLLGEIDVEVSRDGPRLNDGRLAGSTLTMDRAVANMVEWTSDLSGVVVSATATPARLLGLQDRGRIEAGLRADAVILDDSLEVEMTLVAGEVVYRRADH